ncbi:TIGR03089 family protein [Euzebya sp.]|uniref:TIGR03089 family protein n=1 Tax=Euzebya sp. TaxID=1971409 RepID=UPI00351814C6
MTTIFAALTDQTRQLGDRPAVTFVDAGTGERTELSFATLHNWVSKTANLLLDSIDVQLGSEVRLDVPLHWLVPVVALGTWATGAAVRLQPGGDAVVGHELDDPDLEADLLIGIGMGGRPASDEIDDALTVTDVLAQPDEFVDDPQDDGAWAIGGRTQATLLAEPLGASGTRILHAGDRTTAETVFTIARSLPAGVGLVLARGFDADGLARLAAQEGLA